MSDEEQGSFLSKIFGPRPRPELPKETQISADKLDQITREAVAALGDEMRPWPVGLIGSGENLAKTISSIESATQKQGFNILEIDVTKGMIPQGLVNAVARETHPQHIINKYSLATAAVEEICELLGDLDTRTLVVIKHAENFPIGGYIDLARQVRSICNTLSGEGAKPQYFKCSFLMTGSVDPNDRKLWRKGDSATEDNMSKYFYL